MATMNDVIQIVAALTQSIDRMAAQTRDLQNELTQRLIEAIEAIAQTRTKGTIDVKGIGRPDPISGSKEEIQGKWTTWSYKFETWFTSQYTNGERILDWAKQQKDTIKQESIRQFSEDSRIPEEEVKNVDKQLHTAIVHLTQDEALNLVRNTEKKSGLEAYRRIYFEYDPQDPATNWQTLKKLQHCTPVPLERLKQRIEEWETMYRKYTQRTGETLNDDQKQLCIYNFAPEELRRHLDMSRSKLPLYEDMREEIVTYTDTHLSRTGTGAREMDMNWMGKGKKAETKGKGKGKESQPFHHQQWRPRQGGPWQQKGKPSAKSSWEKGNSKGGRPKGYHSPYLFGHDTQKGNYKGKGKERSKGYLSYGKQQVYWMDENDEYEEPQEWNNDDEWQSEQQPNAWDTGDADTYDDDAQSYYDDARDVQSFGLFEEVPTSAQVENEFAKPKRCARRWQHEGSTASPPVKISNQFDVSSADSKENAGSGVEREIQDKPLRKKEFIGVRILRAELCNALQHNKRSGEMTQEGEEEAQQQIHALKQASAVDDAELRHPNGRRFSPRYFVDLRSGMPRRIARKREKDRERSRTFRQEKAEEIHLERQASRKRMMEEDLNVREERFEKSIRGVDAIQSTVSNTVYTTLPPWRKKARDQEHRCYQQSRGPPQERRTENDSIIGQGSVSKHDEKKTRRKIEKKFHETREREDSVAFDAWAQARCLGRWSDLEAIPENDAEFLVQMFTLGSEESDQEETESEENVEVYEVQRGKGTKQEKTRKINDEEEGWQCIEMVVDSGSGEHGLPQEIAEKFEKWYPIREGPNRSFISASKHKLRSKGVQSPVMVMQNGASRRIPFTVMQGLVKPLLSVGKLKRNGFQVVFNDHKTGMHWILDPNTGSKYYLKEQNGVFVLQGWIWMKKGTKRTIEMNATFRRRDIST